MKLRFKPPILLSVFITGAAVLAIEVAATRILAPAFGSSIYSVSSILSVVLGALSAGYWLGGRWADKNPSQKLFFAIIFASGLSVFLLRLEALLLLPVMSDALDHVWGPLVASLALLFVPSFLLGTLSPFAVTLKHKAHPEVGAGQVAGSVFFWSTMGSILGSLLTGFVLVPSFGIRTLTIAVGVVLCLLGLVGMVASGLRWPKLFPMLLAVMAGVGISSMEGTVPGAVYAASGVYADITVIEGNYVGRPSRFLKVEESNSAASFIDSDYLLFPYTRYSRLQSEARPEAKRVHVIGGGGYSIPKQWLSDLPKATVEVSEIEPSLYEVSKKYFRLKDDPRLVNMVVDARAVIQRNDNTYDLIFGDAFYSRSTVPQHLVTREFFAAVKRSLTSDGIYMMNIIGNLSGDNPSYTKSVLRSFRDVFPDMQVIAVAGWLDTGDNQNLMLVGTKNGVPLDYASMKDEMAQEARERLVDPQNLGLEDHVMFTDDFAPVDLYFAKNVTSRDR